VEDADDVVGAVAVDRVARERHAAELLGRLAHRLVGLDGNHRAAGRHHPVGAHVPELQRALHNAVLALGYRASLESYPCDREQQALVPDRRLGPRPQVGPPRQKPGEPLYHPNDGECQQTEQLQRPREQ